MIGRAGSTQVSEDTEARNSAFAENGERLFLFKSKVNLRNSISPSF